jgi:multidrug resistance efflux pump
MATNNDALDDRGDLDNPGRRAALQPEKSKRWLILTPLIILVVLITGYFGVDWWLYSLSHVSTDDARVKGTLITVSSRVAGRLTTMAVETGQPIKRGDLIARIQQDD